MADGDASSHEAAGVSSNPQGPLRKRFERAKAIWQKCCRRLTAKKDRSKAFGKMLYDAYDKSILVNVRAAAFTWILLGGFLSVPAALPKIQQSSAVQNLVGDGVVLRTIRSVSVLCVGTLMLVVGTIGIYYMWRKQKDNFIWVKDRLFYPAFLHALIGLVTTLTRVLTGSPPAWSALSITIVIVSSVAGVLAAALMLLYQVKILCLVDEDCKHVGDTDDAIPRQDPPSS